MKCLIAVLICICIAFNNANARILNVPEEYQTIQTGIDSSRDGDTVLVQPGVYHQTSEVRNKYVVICSNYLFDQNEESIHRTVIDGDSTRMGIVLLRHPEGRKSAIVGLTFVNCCLGIATMEAGAEIQNCRFIENFGVEEPGGAVYCYGSSDIDDCYFEGNRHFHWGGAAALFGDTVRVRSSVFVNNLCGESHCFGGALVTGGRFSEILNCTFVGNIAGNTGGVINLNGSHNTLKNLIFRGNRTIPISITESFEEEGIIDWCLLEGADDSMRLGNESIEWGDNNLNADPLFLDPANGDYHLSANSPCIDAGDPNAPLDPDGTRADMGAFPFHQRDVGVVQREIVFEALPFGESDSQLVVISNTGETDLTILVRQEIEQSTITMREAVGDSIIIPASQGLQLWAIYTSQDQAQETQRFVIGSNDPDEPEVTIEASVFANSVPSDTFHPSIFTLHSAYPNPFNGLMTIRFSVGQVSKPVKLGVYGLDGRLVEELWTGRNARPSQSYSVSWNADSLPGGIYLIRLESGSEVQTIKTILLK